VRVELSSLAEKQLAKIPDHIVRKFALWVAGTIHLVYVEEVNKHDY
jgi:hypothetical protein